MADDGSITGHYTIVPRTSPIVSRRFANCVRRLRWSLWAGWPTGCRSARL